MNVRLRIALYIMAAVVGIGGAAGGLSKGLTLLIIAAVVIPVELLDARYRRTHGNNSDA